MNKIDYKALPEEVQDFIWDVISDFNYDLSDEFSFDFAQFEFINKIEDEILLKTNKVLDFPKDLEKMPGKFDGDFRELALKIAKEVFWPLQDYLGQVDRLILRLGGRVPKPISLIKKKKVNKDILADSFHGKVKDLIKSYKEFKDFRVTPNKIINKKGLRANPSVKNWIEDYIHFLGAGQHGSLERAKYISKSPNALKLGDKFKDNLRFLLLSYDKDIEVYFNRSKGLLNIEEHREKKVLNTEIKDEKVDLDKFLLVFKKDIDDIQNHLLPNDIILSEAQGDINKVRDILWQAVGIGDKDKAVSCLALLITRKSFDLMIKEDNRFRSILKRFIGVRYGQNMERSLDENIDQLILRRLFLEMILVDKLSLNQKTLFTSIFYLTNIISNSGQLIYFDKKDQKLKWCIVQVVGNKFAWLDKV